MRRYLTVLLLAFLSWQWVSAGKHCTVVVSLDGCRWDYPIWYNTPFLDYMASRGVASGLVPSFPSKTFPNHYTLATGLVPDHHGIVANAFVDRESGEVFSLGNRETKLDGRFYGGEPIWLTARRQGVRTAVFYWPGSDVEIQGERPDVFYPYDAERRLTFTERIDGIVAELAKPEESRPRLVMAYFEEPDASGHTFGPQSRETRRAVGEMDEMLRQLFFRIQTLPVGDDVNLIVLSDHGMAWVPSDHRIDLASLLKPEWVEASEGGIPEAVYAREGCVDSVYQALRSLDHVRVWRKTDIPAYLQYGGNSRVGDVVVLPDPGYMIYGGNIPDSGQHGYDPCLTEMHALFRAVGPDFRHATPPHFPNVDVYPLLCHLLGITPAPSDGSLERVAGMLAF